MRLNSAACPVQLASAEVLFMVALRLALFCSVLVLPGIALPGIAVSDEELVKSNRTALPASAEAKSSEVITLTPSDTKAQFMARLNEGPRADGQERIDYESWAGAEEDYKKRRIHGTASVSVGTGGYRNASVSAIMPIGDSGTLGIAYSQTDFGENGAYPYMYDDFGAGYGANYGYGHGYGRYGRGARGGRSQSFALSFDTSSAGGDAGNCPTAFRDRNDDQVFSARDDRRCFRGRHD
jgi:hypothetical protein